MNWWLQLPEAEAEVGEFEVLRTSNHELEACWKFWRASGSIVSQSIWSCNGLDPSSSWDLKEALLRAWSKHFNFKEDLYKLLLTSWRLKTWRWSFKDNLAWLLDLQDEASKMAKYLHLHLHLRLHLDLDLEASMMAYHLWSSSSSSTWSWSWSSWSWSFEDGLASWSWRWSFEDGLA